jgi:acetate kinase
MTSDCKIEIVARFDTYFTTDLPETMQNMYCIPQYILKSTVPQFVK